MDGRGANDGAGPRELRLALGMRGGVSLAVWMGGACAEIDGLRLAADGAGDVAAFYGPLLEAAGFDGVRVDVLAGASAGGLNGALLASSLMYGVDFSAFRDVWLRVADVGALLRRRKDGDATSIMRGEYFLEQMREQLRERLAARDRSRTPPQYLDLHLTVTATTAHPVAVTDDWAAWYAEAAYKAGFRFRHNRYTSDFAGEPTAPVDDAVARAVAGKLAIAARSSSSFPGAFEPARLDLDRPVELGRRADPGVSDDLVGLFSDASHPVAWVIDGGVLDNIPLERAIQSIADAPAAGPTERWLVYLCPSPEDMSLDGPAAEALWSASGAPHLVWTLGAFARAAASRESILDDLASLRAHNDLAYRYRAARELLVGRVSGDTPAATAEALLAAAAESAAVYERDRAARTAGGVRALLEDPVQALGEDPFPEAPGWPLRTDAGVWPRPLREALERSLRAAFAEALRGVAGAEDPQAAAPLGPFPIARAARFLIGELRTLEERLGDETARAAVGAHKQALYHLVDVAGLLSHLGQLFWPVYIAARPPERPEAGLDGWVADATAARAAFLAGAHRDDTLAAEGLADAFSWLRAELARRLHAADESGSWTDADDLLVWLWQRLAGRVEALAGDLAGAVEAPEDADLTTTVQLLEAIRSGQVDALRCLVALEVVAAPLSRISAVPPQPIRFIRLAGSNPTPLARELPELFPDGQVAVAGKLAGNQLANFAAFYKHAWRANDWMWGRLDAVSTLLHILLRPDELAGRLQAAGDGGAAFAAAVRGVVRAPLPDAGNLDEADRDAWARHFATLWDDAKEAVEGEVGQLAGTGYGSLDATVELLTARRQWEILARDLPAVLNAVATDEQEARAAAGALRRLLRWLRRDRPAPAADTHPSTPAGLREVMAGYRVGRESLLDDLGSDRLTRLAADGAVASWAALRFAFGGRPPGLLRPVGPVLSAARWTVLNFPPTRRMLGLGPPKRS